MNKDKHLSEVAIDVQSRRRIRDELDRNFKSLEQENVSQPLSENFAIYLRNYKDVKIGFDGLKIDPSSIIEGEKLISLSNVEDDAGQKYTMDLEII